MRTAADNRDYCSQCIQSVAAVNRDADADVASMATKYPKYYKSVKAMTEVDVYAIHNLFNIQDPSGAIQHASKKLLLSGERTGNKSKFTDIKEARDTLTRWMELNSDL